MESEIQFFMSATDQQEFLEFASTLVDTRSNRHDEHDGAELCILHIGECEMAFKPSVLKGNTLYAGHIRIDTGTLDAHCSDEERAKKIYRKLRNRIKKNYWSRLAFLNKKKKNKLTPSRAYWLGPDAKRWKDADPQHHRLKLSTTSWMIFDIGV